MQLSKLKVNQKWTESTKGSKIAWIFCTNRNYAVCFKFVVFGGIKETRWNVRFVKNRNPEFGWNWLESIKNWFNSAQIHLNMWQFVAVISVNFRPTKTLNSAETEILPKTPTSADTETEFSVYHYLRVKFALLLRFFRCIILHFLRPICVRESLVKKKKGEELSWNMSMLKLEQNCTLFAQVSKKDSEKFTN